MISNGGYGDAIQDETNKTFNGLCFEIALRLPIFQIMLKRAPNRQKNCLFSWDMNERRRRREILNLCMDTVLMEQKVEEGSKEKRGIKSTVRWQSIFEHFSCLQFLLRSN